MQPVNLPLHKSLVNVVTTSVKEIKILDTLNQNRELDVDTAVSRGLTAFKIKLILDPTQFDSISKRIVIDPVYVLTREYR
jgi:hypothetical protein